MRRPSSESFSERAKFFGGLVERGGIAVEVGAAEGRQQQRAVFGERAIGPAWSRLEAKATMP
jgi:hypothetical protein